MKVASVVNRELAAELEFTGSLLPQRFSQIVAEVNGVVKEIPQVGPQIDVTVNGQRYREQLALTLGHPVREGDLLVQIDPRDFEIDLQIAEAKLAKARADLAKLKSWERPEEVRRLTALRQEVAARLQQAQRDLARLEKLLPERAATRSDYEKAAMEVAAYQATVESADANLAKAQAGPTAEELAVQEALVSQAEAEVEQKQRALAKTSIRAPYDGVVTAINVEVGEHASTSSEPLIELMDLRYLAAEIGIPEQHVGAVQIGDAALVDVAGAQEPVRGMVVAINGMVDLATRTFRVRVAIDNESRRFKAGQFATVRLRMDPDRANSLAVPGRSLVFIDGEPHVFVVRDSRVHQQAVEPGLSSDGMVEILDGLQAGDQVVVDDPSLLADGMEVSVVPTVQNVSFNSPVAAK